MHHSFHIWKLVLGITCGTIFIFHQLAFATSCEPLHFRGFSSTLSLMEDSSMFISEKITVDAPSCGIAWLERTVPTAVLDPEGHTYNFEFDLSSLKIDGSVHDFSRIGSTIKVDFTNSLLSPGPHIFELDYKIVQLPSFYAERSELYWPVSGYDWNFSFDNSSIEIKLPSSIPRDQVRIDASVGPLLAVVKRVNYFWKQNTTLTAESEGPIPAQQSLLIHLSWPRGFIAESPNAAEQVKNVGHSGAADSRDAALAPEVLQKNQSTLAERQGAAANIAMSAVFPEDAIPMLIAMLDESQEYAQKQALLALVRGRKKVIEPLQRALEQSKIKNPRYALIALGMIGPQALPVAPYAVSTLENPATPLQDRVAASYMLSRLGPQAASFVPALIKLTTDKNLRLNGLLGLGSVGSADGVPTLIQYLSSFDSSERQAAAESLGNIGKFAAEAVPELIKLLSDPNSDVASVAAHSLGEISDPVSIPDLIKASKKSALYLHSNAAEALTHFESSEARIAIKEYQNTQLKQILYQLESQDEKERCSAAFALGDLGSVAEPAFEKLLAKVTQDSKGVCTNAIYALGSLGVKGKTAIPILESLLEGYDLSWCAAGSLAAIGTPEAQKALREHEQLIIAALIMSLQSSQRRSLDRSYRALQLIDSVEARNAIE